MLVVGIGASAGGLEAFSELLKHLPADTGMGFVLIQHLDPAHESALTQILARSASIPVREATRDMRVEPDHVYIIPPNTSMTIVKGVLKLTKRQAPRTVHRSIDSFFESLAEDMRERAIGVVLSGTASDGTLGLEAIKAEGGLTFAQDESAKYDSMPRSAIVAGCVDLVLSPQRIARELTRISRHPYVIEGDEHPEAAQAEAQRVKDLESAPGTPLVSGGRGTPAIGARRARAEARASRKRADDGGGYEGVLALLRSHSGVDFSLYKSNTIRRRVTRRVVLGGHRSIDEYARALKGNVKELDALYSDVLISVTSFFRNPESFEALKRIVFPKIVAHRGRAEPLRTWVLGCSTGQEAYSIAMAYAEFSEQRASPPKLQIFATDLNESLLEKARQGLYSRSLAQDVSPERLRQFFVEEEGGYRVSKALREQVVFARQNVISDPPFSRMDLISCRNLLIYLEGGLQKQILPAFHYALRPGGFLVLGASESVGGFAELFTAVDQKHKIFARKTTTPPGFRLPLPDRLLHMAELRLSPAHQRARAEERAEQQLRRDFDAQREADRTVLGLFGPPSVLVNSDFQILQFRGPTGPFLVPPTGRATFDLLKMAREGLLIPLRTALNAARRHSKPVRQENVRVMQNGSTRVIDLQVLPLKNLRERTYLVLFEPRRATSRPAAPQRRPLGKRQEASRVAELERELAETRDYLQSTREDHEAANEELQASGEEVQSANEELQSINEELETSKEELESTNEELTTVNEEMGIRNAELGRANADLNNLLLNMNMPVLLFSRKLMLRRFTTQAEKLFNLMPSDVGRSIGGIRHNLELPDLEALLEDVVGTLGLRERDVRAKDGHWYALRARPYMTSDDTMDGVVLVLTDITERKRGEEGLGRLAAIVDSSADSIVSANLDGVVTTWNRGAERLYGHTAREIIGRSMDLLMPPGSEARDMLERVRSGRDGIAHIETARRRKDGSLVEVSMTLSPVFDPGGEIIGISEICRDMSDQRRAAKEREVLLGSEQRARDDAVSANNAKDLFLATLSHEVRSPLNAILGWASLLRADNASAEDVRRGIEVIERNARLQARLIDDVLDISSIISGKLRLDLRLVDLQALIHTAADSVRTDAESKKLKLALHLDQGAASVICDPARIQQALQNLLSNAVKFTPHGGKITVSSRRDGVQVRIIVTDTGRGISPEHLVDIFDRFRQVDSSIRGLGLGLSIVKQIVELHGGSIEASSDGRDLGSTFTMTLPIVAEPIGPTTLTPREAAAGAGLPAVRSMVESPVVPVRLEGLRVIVVDDEEDARQLLQRVLEGAGAKVEVCASGRQAIEALEHTAPGESVALVSDVHMPEMDGLSLVKQIRRRNEFQAMPAVALTAYAHHGDRDKALAAGFQVHLLKPVDPFDLIVVLSELVAAGRK